jgi:hypothetical protein
MLCRGIRGATVAAGNTREDILTATRELLQRMVESNQVDREMVACVFFTTLWRRGNWAGLRRPLSVGRRSMSPAVCPDAFGYS